MVIQVSLSGGDTADTPSQTEGHKAIVEPVKEEGQVRITCHTPLYLISN